MALNDYITFETGIILIILISAIAFLVPAMYQADTTPDSVTVEQTEGQILTLTAGLEATLVNVDDSQREINITLVDTNSGDTVSTILSEGQNTTLSIGGESVTIDYPENIGPSSAVIIYTYPLYYGWPVGVRTMMQFFIGFIVFLVVAFLWFLITLQENTNG